MHSRWGLLKRFFYYTVTLLVVMGVIKTYLAWYDSYNMLHPEVVQAMAMGYVEELPMKGVLVWDEQIMKAPRDGVLTYPSPLPRRVAKNEPVAALDGAAVKADGVGYFLPALDGQEGQWVYSRLWPGIAQFPVFELPRPVESGKRIRKGTPLGKLIPQPQDLRYIAYLDRIPSLEQDIKQGFINIKTEPHGKVRRASVRAFINAGLKMKVYVTLPFFPPSVLNSRAFSCSVVTGDRQGVSVPETAVILRGGKMGVLLVQGGITEFTEVEGFPVDEGNFFVTKGIVPGNVVVLHAGKVKEGVIRLW